MRTLAIEDSQTPEVQSLAHRLGEPAAVEAFLRKLWVIVADPLSAEYIRTPSLQLRLLRTVKVLSGDCDDAATLAASLLFALGWPCLFRAIRMPGDTEFSHVWLSCPVEGAWLDIDPIVPMASMPVRGFVEVMELEV